MIEDASYIRLKNIQVGYTLPKKWINKIHIKNIRVYIAGHNLLTFSAMNSNWDPEVSDGSGRIYPVTKTMSVGLNVKF